MYVRMLSVVIGIIAFTVACDPGPDYCPPAKEEFRTSYELRQQIDSAIKAELQDPNSYERHEIFARQAYATSRENGTEYFERLEVDFGARNAFGGW